MHPRARAPSCLAVPWAWIQSTCTVQYIPQGERPQLLHPQPKRSRNVLRRPLYSRVCGEVTYLNFLRFRGRFWPRLADSLGPNLTNDADQHGFSRAGAPDAGGPGGAPARFCWQVVCPAERLAGASGRQARCTAEGSAPIRRRPAPAAGAGQFWGGPSRRGEHQLPDSHRLGRNAWSGGEDRRALPWIWPISAPGSGLWEGWPASLSP